MTTAADLGANLSLETKKRYNWLISQGIDMFEAFVLAPDEAKVKEMRDKIELILAPDTVKVKVEPVDDNVEAVVTPTKAVVTPDAVQVEKMRDKDKLKTGLAQPVVNFDEAMRTRFEWFREQGYNKVDSTNYARQEIISLSGFDNPNQDKWPILMAVSTRDYPKTVFTLEQANEIKAGILEQAVHQQGEKPRIHKCTFLNGYLLVECGNKPARLWICTIVHRLVFSAAVTCGLKVSPQHVLLKTHVRVGSFVDSVKNSTTEILNMLERQNDGINTSKWKIVSRIATGKMKSVELTFTVDPDSAKIIKKLGYQLNYKFSRVRLVSRRLTRTNNLSDNDKIHRNAGNPMASRVWVRPGFVPGSGCLDPKSTKHTLNSHKGQGGTPVASGSHVKTSAGNSQLRVKPRNVGGTRVKENQDSARTNKFHDLATKPSRRSKYRNNPTAVVLDTSSVRGSGSEAPHSKNFSEPRNPGNVQERVQLNRDRSPIRRMDNEIKVRAPSPPRWINPMINHSEDPRSGNLSELNKRENYSSSNVVKIPSNAMADGLLHQPINQSVHVSDRDTERQRSIHDSRNADDRVKRYDPIGSANAPSSHSTDHYDLQRVQLNRDRSPNRRMNNDVKFRAPSPPRCKDNLYRINRSENRRSDNLSELNDRGNAYSSRGVVSPIKDGFLHQPIHRSDHVSDRDTERQRNTDGRVNRYDPIDNAHASYSHSTDHYDQQLVQLNRDRSLNSRMDNEVKFREPSPFRRNDNLYRNQHDEDLMINRSEDPRSNNIRELNVGGNAYSTSGVVRSPIIHQQIHQSDQISDRNTERRRPVHGSRNTDDLVNYNDPFGVDNGPRPFIQQRIQINRDRSPHRRMDNEVAPSPSRWDDNLYRKEHDDYQMNNRLEDPRSENLNDRRNTYPSSGLARSPNNAMADGFVHQKTHRSDQVSDRYNENIRSDQFSDRDTERRRSVHGAQNTDDRANFYDPIGIDYASRSQFSDSYDQQRDPMNRDQSQNRRMNNEVKVRARSPHRMKDYKQEDMIRSSEQHDLKHHSRTSPGNSHHELLKRNSMAEDQYELRRSRRDDIPPLAFNRAPSPPRRINDNQRDVKRPRDLSVRNTKEGALSRNGSFHSFENRETSGPSTRRDNPRLDARHDRIPSGSGRDLSNSSYRVGVSNPPRSDRYDHRQNHRSENQFGISRLHEERFRHRENNRNEGRNFNGDGPPGHRVRKDHDRDRLPRRSPTRNNGKPYRSR